MRKFYLQPEENACVEQASTWARALTTTESRGPGDLRNAWRRLEHRYGIPSQAFWSLRYRRPNKITATIWQRLREAYEAECNRQMRRLQHEIEITRQIAGARHLAVHAAEIVAREKIRGREMK
jgi:hypothetical protein